MLLGTYVESQGVIIPSGGATQESIACLIVSPTGHFLGDLSGYFRLRVPS